MVAVWFETEIDGIDGDVTVEANVSRSYDVWYGGRRAMYEVTKFEVFVLDDQANNQNKYRNVTAQLKPEVQERLEERACELYEEFACG